LPPGRTPIRTELIKASERQQAYDLIRREVEAGQRAYVVLPLVEESEKLELRSAVEVHRQLGRRCSRPQRWPVARSLGQR
jgi:ATP-dependent DNA helicase RecG